VTLELLVAGRPVVVLLSGGRDSVCLLDAAVTRGTAVSVLHVNYGLRAQAGEDEAFCRALCERLGVPLTVHAPAARPRGNVQAWARAERYGAAEAFTGDIAVGHTATDQVETVLYRLAASPGRRALLGMRPRDGRVIRPLLDMTRDETAAHCRARGLAWREDASNDDPVYARNRARAGLVPALRELHPAAEANVLRTLAILRDEAEVLDALLADAGPFADLPAALQRLVLQRLADEAWAEQHAECRVPRTWGRETRHSAPAVGSRAAAVAEVARRGGTHHLDLGGGLRAVTEYGRVRVELAAAAPAPGPVTLPIPGAVAWGEHELRAERGADLAIGDGTLAGVGDQVEVRAWRPGDRMQPLGLGGSRTLQDLFTDRKVPRAQRHALPVVLARGEIAWVPGVATGERFRVTAATRDRVRLSWS
jgi:tRNA(Ile)-lysidine synthase